MIEIDFYHIDAFEVSVFLPIYHALENIGVRPRPILPNDAISTASIGYLNINQCIKFYKKNKIKYYSTPNYNNPVCTTQGAEFLSLYRNLRIRIPYGPGIYPYGWGLTRKSTIGFDCILVHGRYYKKYLSCFTGINKIHVVGYPRYDDFFSGKSNNKKTTSCFGIDSKLNTILMLPTWGENSSLDRLLEFTKKLQDRFNILLKPHHLSIVKRPDILNTFEDSKSIVLRKSDDLIKAISVSDIIICDIRSCSFGESILANKKTIGLALNESDRQWVSQAQLDKISYIAYNINDVTNYIEEYVKYDEFSKSRGIWIQDKVEILNGSSSEMTAKILQECINTYHISLFKKILRKYFSLIFTKGGVDQRLSTKISSLLHFLIIKSLGNYK